MPLLLHLQALRGAKDFVEQRLEIEVGAGSRLRLRWGELLIGVGVGERLLASVRRMLVFAVGKETVVGRLRQREMIGIERAVRGAEVLQLLLLLRIDGGRRGVVRLIGVRRWQCGRLGEFC